MLVNIKQIYETNWISSVNKFWEDVAHAHGNFLDQILNGEIV